VRLWMRNAAAVGTLRDRPVIDVIGEMQGSYELELITSDLAEVVRGCRLICVVLPAHAHEAIARTLAPLLAGDETILLHPGRTAGAVAFRRALLSIRPHLTGVRVGETQSLIYTCRLTDARTVELFRVKTYGQMAFLGAGNSDDTEEIGVLRALFPQAIMEPSTLVTGFANIGAVLHPAPMLLNAGSIEREGNPFLFYYEAITPTIAGLVEALDSERCAVATAYGLPVLSIREWHGQCYGVMGETLYDTIRMNIRYASLETPRSLTHRYLREDVPTGLIPLISLADAAGIDVPHMRTVRDLAQLVLRETFDDTRRDAVRLGIAGRSLGEIQEIFR